MMNHKYDSEQGPIPQFKISNDLANLTKIFIISALIYFIIAGSLALIMRTIQSNLMILDSQNKTFGLFYTSLTIHGQLMFFGFSSMLVFGISYYLLSKFAQKPLFSFGLAILSFSFLNAGAILLIISGTLFFGAGWYNLMPLAFHSGNNGWSILSVSVFLIAELLIGIALTIFCVNVIGTVLKGKIAVGIQKTEINDSTNDKNLGDYDDKHKASSDDEDSGKADLFELKAGTICIKMGIIIRN